VEAEALVTLTTSSCTNSRVWGSVEKPGDGLRLPQRQAGPALQHRSQGDREEVQPAAATAIAHCAQEAISINLETEKAVIDPAKCGPLRECILVSLRQHPDPVERIHPRSFSKDDGIPLTAS